MTPTVSEDMAEALARLFREHRERHGFGDPPPAVVYEAGVKAGLLRAARMVRDRAPETGWLCEVPVNDIAQEIEKSA